MSGRSAADAAAHARISARLRDHAVEVRRLFAGLDEDALTRRTVSGKWSLSEENPEIAYYGPEGDLLFEEMADRPAAETLDDFLAERGLLIGRLEKLSLDEWHRPGRHPEFENYDVHLQMDYLAHHEAHHVYQMFQRRTPLGRIPAGD
jgi:hypothetical protein